MTPGAGVAGSGYCPWIGKLFVLRSDLRLRDGRCPLDATARAARVDSANQIVDLLNLLEPGDEGRDTGAQGDDGLHGGYLS